MKRIIVMLITITVMCIVILFVRDKNSDTEPVQKVEPTFLSQAPVAVTQTISNDAISTSQGCRTPIVTEYYHFDGGENSEEILWELLNKYAPNTASAAGALGMIYRETKYKSNAFCGWPSHRLENPNCCEEFTKKIDDGLLDGTSLDDFILYIQEAYGGFGLYSLCGSVQLKRFYNFAQEWGTTIADAEMQCAFLFWDIENYYPELWEMLIGETDAYNAGENLGIFYDGTQEYDAIAYFAEERYQKYVNGVEFEY